MEMKEFTQSDFETFGGAENFADGSAPLIGDDGDQYLVIADGRGLSVVGDEDEWLWTPANNAMWAPSVARQLASSLLYPELGGCIGGEILEVLGFKTVR